jgi:glycosyltransferase involved in cell wall biosynthesis
MKVKTLIMLPCYNEQHSLPKLLDDLMTTNHPEKYSLHIVVINDCSKDDTAKVAKQYKVNLINLPVNLGIGGAVQSGLKFALRNDFDLAVQMDGDGQHPPGELHKLLDCYEKSGANVVIGSRFIEKKGFQTSFVRRMGIRYFHWLNKLMTGKSIYDSTSGFRLFDKKAIALAATNYPDDYPEPESLIIFSKAGFTIAETPVQMLERTTGKSSIGKSASIYYTIKVTLAMFFSFIRKLN